MLRIVTLILLLCLLPFTAAGQAGEEEPKATIQRLDFWTSFLESKAPEYVWGGYDPDVVIFDEHRKAYRKGVDCSGSLYWIFRKSGVGFIRTTSLKMFLGAWPGYNITAWKEAQFPDLLFFTFSADRPRGHVSLIRGVEKNGLWIAHASSMSNKFIRVFLKADSKMLADVSGIRVLDLLPRSKPKE